MAAADFFGNCQICGSEQKSHPNKIAKHGYTIQYGWQMGECFGSGAAPYQKSNDRILDAIEAAKLYIKNTKAAMDDLRANPFEKEGTVWTEYTVQRFGDKQNGSVTLSMNAKGGIEARDRTDRLVFVSMNGHPKTVEEAAHLLAKTRISRMLSSVKQAEASIPYMQKRYDDWKPVELRPVTAADRAASAPKLHFAATKFGRKTAVCVGSATGASAYKQTTDDRSKVTCAACLKELARIDDLPRLKAEQAEKDRQKAIKACERDIKEYTKLIKRGGLDTEVLRWTQYLAAETAKLEVLKAQAPAPAAQ